MVTCETDRDTIDVKIDDCDLTENVVGHDLNRILI